MNGPELLKEFRATRSDTAFAGLLRHYASLVYSVARRRLTIDSLAQDATQTVFVRLAANPPNLRGEPELIAWLHRTTVHVSIDLWRSETRRHQREQEAVRMQIDPDESSRIWYEIAPELDIALNELGDDDRQTLLLRFFEAKSMREVGVSLGISEDAAKMRVSRAVRRLRDGLANRAVACTLVGLTALLSERAITAAPVPLIAHLLALKPALFGSAAILKGSGPLAQILQSKVLLTTAAVVVISFAILLLVPKPHFSRISSVPAQTTLLPETRTTPALMRRKREHVPVFTAAEPAADPSTRFIFRAEDAESGVGIPGVNMGVAYFYAGGQGESHAVETDFDGNARIPPPNNPDQKAGLNLFASVPGYVPKCISFGATAPTTNYLLRLDPALAIGGTVVDELGQPVPGVMLQASRSQDDRYNDHGPTTDFQTSPVKSDLDGHWYCPYVPKSYDELRVHLTCSNYAVTQYIIPVRNPDALNTTLVIRRGFVVIGQVVDANERPVVGAKIKELHEYGWRHLSAQTDTNGNFELRGLGVPAETMVNYLNPTRPGEIAAQSIEPVKLTVQARGFAPQEQTIKLVNATNHVSFKLGPGQLFRGHILDDTGQPIAGAVIRTDYDFKNQIPTRYQWTSKSDINGTFEWDSAPNENTCFWFEADGHEIVRGQSFRPDGTDHEIVLKRLP